MVVQDRQLIDGTQRFHDAAGGFAIALAAARTEQQRAVKQLMKQRLNRRTVHPPQRTKPQQRAQPARRLDDFLQRRGIDRQRLHRF